MRTISIDDNWWAWEEYAIKPIEMAEKMYTKQRQYKPK